MRRRLLSSPVGNQAYVNLISVQFTHRVINKVAIETAFLCIPSIKRKCWARGGRLFEGGACLIFWPRGWMLIWGRALIRENTVNI